MTRSLGLAIALVATAATGCVSEPAVRLHHAELVGATPQGLRFDSVLAIENDNSFDIQIRAVRANVGIDGVRGLIGVGVEPGLWLPSGRTTLLAVPVVIPWGMIPGVAGATLFGPDPKYRVQGFADVTATRALEIDRDQYEFQAQGTLPKSFFVGAGPGGISIGVGGSR